MNGDKEEDTMRRMTLIGVVAIGLALLVTVPAVGMATLSDSGAAEQASNATAPGERLAGVVGVQQAEIEAGLEHRAFNIRLQRAASESEQADTVSEQVRDVETRIEELEQRKDELEAMREAGEISEGRYRAEIARVATQIEALETLSNQSARAAGELPAELLEERGVNVTAIQTLQERANELSGGEVAEIARDIGGGPPEDLGPPVNQTRGPDNETVPPGQGDDTPGDDPPNEDPPGDDPPNEDPPGEDPPGDDPPGDDPPSDDPPGDDPPGDDPPGDDPPSDDPPGDDPPGDDPPDDDPPGDDPPGDDPPGDDPPGDDPPGDDPPGDDPPGDDPLDDEYSG